MHLLLEKPTFCTGKVDSFWADQGRSRGSIHYSSEGHFDSLKKRHPPVFFPRKEEDVIKNAALKKGSGGFSSLFYAIFCLFGGLWSVIIIITLFLFILS
jgi:hypothetical protein